MKRLAFVPLALALVGCPPEEDAVDSEACGHLQALEGSGATAAVDPVDAPAISNDHVRYNVTLTPVAGGNGGYVKFTSPSAGDWAFVLDAPVPLAVEDEGGATVPILQSYVASPDCAEIEGRHDVTLGVGTYYLSLGPSTETLVRVVVERI